EAVPGVVAILTRADLKDIDPYYGHAVRDRPNVAIDVARFAGDPVAVVAAENAHIAAEALKFIQIDYEILPSVTTIEEALTENAPRLHDTDTLRLGYSHGLGKFTPHGNICYEHHMTKGQTEDIFAKADVIVEGEYRFPAVYQYA